jgi:hypothetical protein
MKCLKCGSENGANAKFCRGCGTKLEGIEKIDAEEQRKVDLQEQERRAEARKKQFEMWRHRIWGNRQRKVLTLTCGLIVVLLATVAVLPKTYSDSLQDLKCWVGPHENAFKATVTADEARFIFPVGKKDHWEWNVKRVSPGRVDYVDYTWMVQIPRNPPYDRDTFGFSHIIPRQNWNDGQPQGGDFAALIAAGTVRGTLIRAMPPSPDGARAIRSTDFPGVSVQQACESVVVLITGKENVQSIFSLRPEKVKFVAVQPGNPEVSEDVSVNYEK